MQEDAYDVAVTAVKSRLPVHFREDGPPLSIEYDPLPPCSLDSPLGFSVSLSLSLSLSSGLLYFFVVVSSLVPTQKDNRVLN